MHVRSALPLRQEKKRKKDASSEPNVNETPPHESGDVVADGLERVAACSRSFALPSEGICLRPKSRPTKTKRERQVVGGGGSGGDTAAVVTGLSTSSQSGRGGGGGGGGVRREGGGSGGIEMEHFLQLSTTMEEVEATRTSTSATAAVNSVEGDTPLADTLLMPPPDSAASSSALAGAGAEGLDDSSEDMEDMMEDMSGVCVRVC